MDEFCREYGLTGARLVPTDLQPPSYNEHRLSHYLRNESSLDGLATCLSILRRSGKVDGRIFDLYGSARTAGLCAEPHRLVFATDIEVAHDLHRDHTGSISITEAMSQITADDVVYLNDVYLLGNSQITPQLLTSMFPETPVVMTFSPHVNVMGPQGVEGAYYLRGEAVHLVTGGESDALTYSGHPRISLDFLKTTSNGTHSWLWEPTLKGLRVKLQFFPRATTPVFSHVNIARTAHYEPWWTAAVGLRQRQIIVDAVMTDAETRMDMKDPRDTYNYKYIHGQFHVALTKVHWIVTLSRNNHLDLSRMVDAHMDEYLRRKRLYHAVRIDAMLRLWKVALVLTCLSFATVVATRYRRTLALIFRLMTGSRLRDNLTFHYQAFVEQARSLGYAVPAVSAGALATRAISTWKVVKNRLRPYRPKLCRPMQLRPVEMLYQGCYFVGPRGDMTPEDFFNQPYDPDPPARPFEQVCPVWPHWRVPAQSPGNLLFALQRLLRPPAVHPQLVAQKWADNPPALWFPSNPNQITGFSIGLEKEWSARLKTKRSAFLAALAMYEQHRTPVPEERVIGTEVFVKREKLAEDKARLIRDGSTEHMVLVGRQVWEATQFIKQSSSWPDPIRVGRWSARMCTTDGTADSVATWYSRAMELSPNEVAVLASIDDSIVAVNDGDQLVFITADFTKYDASNTACRIVFGDQYRWAGPLRWALDALRTAGLPEVAHTFLWNQITAPVTITLPKRHSLGSERYKMSLQCPCMPTGSAITYICGTLATLGAWQLAFANSNKVSDLRDALQNESGFEVKSSAWKEELDPEATDFLKMSPIFHGDRVVMVQLPGVVCKFGTSTEPLSELYPKLRDCDRPAQYLSDYVRSWSGTQMNLLQKTLFNRFARHNLVHDFAETHKHTWAAVVDLPDEVLFRQFKRYNSISTPQVVELIEALDRMELPDGLTENAAINAICEIDYGTSGDQVLPDPAGPLLF